LHGVNHLSMKSNPFYLKTQSVPRCKHCKNQLVNVVKGKLRCFLSETHTKHVNTLWAECRIFVTLKLMVHTLTARLLKVKESCLTLHFACISKIIKTAHEFKKS